MLTAITSWIENHIEQSFSSKSGAVDCISWNKCMKAETHDAYALLG